MNATTPVRHPFTATMIGAVGRRQVVENARVIAQALAAFALLGAAIWAIV